MDSVSFKTVSANKATATKNWVLVNAEGQTLGRLASQLAILIRGKHKTNFTPHMDCGDNVVVINAEKVVLSGAKLDDKEYVRHTGYPGGQRFTTPRELFAKNPSEVITKAVYGMLPKNKLGRAINKNLHVFAGSEHHHQAQQPKEININTIR